MNDHTFKKIYWGPDQSTEVIFEATDELPPIEQITACIVAALHDNDNLVLSRPERGWGLIGGHIEPGETPEECVCREADEEAAAVLGELQLIGRWATKKRFHSPHNEKYPERGYQLLYLAPVLELKEFTPQLEIFERAVVSFSEIHQYHHRFDDFADVMHYIQDVVQSER
jgi:8-oxo-dGTP diphosphatase